MKLVNNVHIKSDLSKSQQIVWNAVNDLPGESASDIGRHLTMLDGTVGSSLHRLINKGRIKRRRLDGTFRYYPNNYQFSDEVKHYFKCTECEKNFSGKQALNMHRVRMHTEAGMIGYLNRQKPEVTEPVAETPAPSLDISSLAKDYYWETQDDSLRGFVTWMKNR